MFDKLSRLPGAFLLNTFLLAVLFCIATVGTAAAQHTADGKDGETETPPAVPHAVTGKGHIAPGTEDAEEGAEHGSAFDPEHGTWLNSVARKIFGEEDVKWKTHEGERHIANPTRSVKYDYIIISMLIMLALAALGVLAARQVRVRPEGKATSLANLFEAALEGYRNYLIGVMGPQLAMKYAPLIASFFFTILFFNWIGLIPGLLSPTSNPNVPFSLAICAFFCVHIIAIKEAGIKSWFMHFVGEPVWMAPLNFPLHIIGELVKPVSLSLRLLGNVFGEEVVIVQIAGLAILAAHALNLPTFIPLQLPILLLSVFFGMLQALVFSTLLAIYIAVLGTHHDDHDEHNAHGHTEHVRLHGYDQVVAHPSESTLA